MTHAPGATPTDAATISLDTPIVTLDRAGIPYFGAKRAAQLAAAVASSAGCSPPDATVEDLLNYTPLRYEDRSNLARVADLDEDVEAAIEVEVRVAGAYPVAGGRYRIFELSGADATGQIRAYWWNRRYLANTFKQGTRVILFGLWRRSRKGGFEVENPDYEVLSEDDDLQTSAIHTGRRVPVYRKLG